MPRYLQPVASTAGPVAVAGLLTAYSDGKARTLYRFDFGLLGSGLSVLFGHCAFVLTRTNTTTYFGKKG